MPPKRRLKKKISIKLKKEIVKKYNEGVKINALVRVYNLCQSTISTIIKQSEILEKIEVSDNSNTVEKGRELIMKMEKLLLKWLKENQIEFNGFSMQCICERAKRIFDELKLNSPSTAETRYDDFKASKGWFERFKNRCELEKVLHHEKVATSDKDATEFFKTTELEKTDQLKYQNENFNIRNEIFLHKRSIYVDDTHLKKEKNSIDEIVDTRLLKMKSQVLPDGLKNKNSNIVQNPSTSSCEKEKVSFKMLPMTFEPFEKHEDEENGIKDSFYYFAMSIAEQLRNMPEEHVYHCQVEIQNIIMAKRVAIFNESKNPE